MADGAGRTYAALGADLALTPWVGTPSPLALVVADSWGSLDLSIAPPARTAQRRTPDTLDLRAVSARENLAQALVIRLLTPVGDLGPLGHPTYGSRLVELIGRRNDVATRNLARLYTLQAIAAEPRVLRTEQLDVSVPPGSPDTVRIVFSVIPVGDETPISAGLEVTL